MKNLLITYNCIFLLAGNVFLLNLHFMHDDHHHSDNTEECQECIIIKYNNDYVSDYNKVNFLKNKTNHIQFEYVSIINFNGTSTCLSRAPPIS